MRLRGPAAGSRSTKDHRCEISPRCGPIVIGHFLQLFIPLALKSFGMRTSALLSRLLNLKHLSIAPSSCGFTHLINGAPVTAIPAHTYANTRGRGRYPNSVTISRLSTLSFRLAAAALLATLLTGCAVPLGPGFRLRSRQLTLTEAAAPAAPVHIRVAESMENTGNRPLAFLDVSLPTAGRSAQEQPGDSHRRKTHRSKS